MTACNTEKQIEYHRAEIARIEVSDEHPDTPASRYTVSVHVDRAVPGAVAPRGEIVSVQAYSRMEAIRLAQAHTRELFRTIGATLWPLG